jgi:predicted ester cyclase
MTPDENKKTARRIVIELFNAGKLDLIDKLIAANFIEHGAPPGARQGRDGFRAMIPVLRSAFPDLEYIIEDQIAEGDRVVQRVVGHGTMKGEFMGMQPTGKRAEWQEMHIHRFDAEGKLAEHWETSNELSMIAQLGLVPRLSAEPKSKIA